LETEEILELITQYIRRGVGQKERLEFIKFQIENSNSISPNDEEYVTSLKKNFEESSPFPTKIESTSENVKGKTDANNCIFCNKALKFGKRLRPEKIWYLEGKLCKNCFKEIKACTNIFDATYNEGIKNILKKLQTDKIKGKLIIQNFKNCRRIMFVANKIEHREIISKIRIINFDKIPFSDDSVAGKIKSKIGKKATKPHLIVNYRGMHINKNAIFWIKDLEKAFKEIDHLMLSKS